MSVWLHWMQRVPQLILLSLLEKLLNDFEVFSANLPSSNNTSSPTDNHTSRILTCSYADFSTSISRITFQYFSCVVLHCVAGVGWFFDTQHPKAVMCSALLQQSPRITGQTCVLCYLEEAHARYETWAASCHSFLFFYVITYRPIDDITFEK